jgi:replicative DNA helicase
MNDPTSTTRFDGTASTPVANSSEAPRPKLHRLDQLLTDFRSEADAAHEARVSGQPRGAISGLSTLDRELAGAFAPGIHALHGNTGSGKTALALQIAAKCQCPALFVTCEMSPVELLRRLTANLTSTFLGRLKNGELRGQDAEVLALRAIEQAPNLAIIDATRAAATPAYLQECAEIVKGTSPHLFVAIDSLHTWTQTLTACGDRNDPLYGLSEYEALNGAIRSLQILASTLSAPILMICERNRESMKGGGGNASLNAGAGTRKIEYQCETVLDLDRKSETFEDGAGEIDVTLRLAKNRHGAAGKSVPLKFNGALQRFSEVKKSP